jgi:hypothetical protein
MRYVLVPKLLYESLTTDEHDDRPWTPEKRSVLALEAVLWTIGDHGSKPKPMDADRAVPVRIPAVGIKPTRASRHRRHRAGEQRK